ncbi:hypothetical protein B0T25DRAFT_33064 [Lasiosphaeria hispida]|uniref:Apple domain-containing protein n=1 Tax=Lasiosphaeria hispida TaxID=260671 RepID=A0AAJ0HUV9_9PEZI|nr:hypothetical protein B0T25DRAFT_33064 [Lasiosphaeria hispida]
MDLQRQGSTSQPPPLNRNNSHSRVRFAEEEPGLEVYHPPAAKPREKAPVENAPEVYWADDRENEANLSHYTFYREDTPTPPEFDDREKAVGYGAATAVVADRAAAAGGRGHGNFSQFDTSGASSGSLGESQDGQPRINRKRLWVIVAIVLLCVTAIAVGVGVGVGKTKRTSSDAPAAAAAAASTSSVSIRASPTAASSSSRGLAGTFTTSTGPSLSSPAPQATTTTTRIITINSDCPAANNTIYSVPGSTKSFLRLCGLDYSSADGATDLVHVPTNSMAECINNCASYDQCTGCAWGYIAGDNDTGAHRCWMKKELKSSHVANNDFCFAILR